MHRLCDHFVDIDPGSSGSAADGSEYTTRLSWMAEYGFEESAGAGGFHGSGGESGGYPVPD